MLGRESGTPSAKKTADWIRDQYIAMGAYPAFASGYTHWFCQALVDNADNQALYIKSSF
jgi:hypothetical protein